MTSTSTGRPSSAWFCVPRDLVLQRRSAARSAPARPPWAPGRPWSPPACPARLEYWKVKALANRACRTASRVCSKSASVSPGKPTMMSVVIAASRHRRADPVDDLEVALAAVAAPHRPQHRVRPGLHRHVQLRADVRRLGHRRDHVVGEVARMRAGEAHPLEPVDLAAGPQQLAERAAGRRRTGRRS